MTGLRNRNVFSRSCRLWAFNSLLIVTGILSKAAANPSTQMAAELDALTLRVNTLQESYREISTQYDRKPTKSLSVQPVSESYSGSSSRSLPKVAKAQSPLVPSVPVMRVGRGYYLGFAGGV